MDDKTPGNWELMRGIDSINKRLDDIVKGFVSIAVYNLLVEEVKEVKADLQKEKAERQTTVIALQAQAEDQRKSRAQTWLALGVAAAGVAFGVFGSIIRQGLGLP